MRNFLKFFNKKTMAVTASAAVALSGGVSAAFAANVKASDNPYAVTTITKTYDGTDQGTPSGTFMTTANGFTPGDNDPNDGIVASNDSVGYELETRVNAGPARTIYVNFVTPEFLNIYSSNNSAMCPGNSLATGEILTENIAPNETIVTGCKYKVPAGVGFTVKQSVVATALDSKGVAEDNQIMSVKTSLTQNATNVQQFSADPVTVISAPTADLTIRPSTCYKNHSCTLQSYGDKSGSLFIEATKLKWPGYNNYKGISTLGDWTADLNISEFPAGTSWFIKNTDGSTTPLTVNNGVIALGPYSGDVEIGFTAPDDWGYPDPAEGTEPSVPGFPEEIVKDFNAHLIVPETAFEVPNGYKNNGTGWEPGQNEASSYSTYNDKGTGAIEGYLYPNNDWTKITVYRPKLTSGAIFGKALFRPRDTNQTLWEDGNKMFNGNNETPVPQNQYGGPFPNVWDVTNGTEMKTLAQFDTSSIAGTVKKAMVSDAWDNNYVSFDNSRSSIMKLTAPDGTVLNYGTDYILQWTDTVTGTDIYKMEEINNEWDFVNDGWTESPTSPIANPSAVRAIFTNNILSGESGGSYILTIPTIVKDGLELNNSTATADYVRGNFLLEGESEPHFSANGEDKNVPISVTINTIPKPSVDIDLTANKTDISPSVTDVTYTASPVVKDLISTVDTINGTLTVNFPSCINSYSLPQNSPYEYVSGDLTETCKTNPNAINSVKFKLKNDWAPSSNFSGSTATLPNFIFNTVWSKLTSPESSRSLSVEWDLTTINGDQNSKLPVNSVNASWALNRAASEGTIQQITTSTPIQEINEPLQYQAFTEIVSDSKNGNYTIVAMPNNNDSAYKGLFTSGAAWDETVGIDGSSYNGTYTVSDVNIVTEDSVEGTSLQCTTDNNPSLTNGSENTWVDCKDSNNNLISEITAVKIMQEGGDNQGISTVNFTLTPQGNKKGDNYLMWIGPATINNSSEVGPLSFPAKDTIVNSMLTGYVYWDTWGKGSNFNPDTDKGIEGINVNVKNETTGNIIATTQTDENGYYSFDDLKSGSYVVEIPEIGEEGGVPKTMPSAFYPDKNRDVKQTYSYNGMRLGYASTTSSVINLTIGNTVNNVNFGFNAPDPYSDLEKTPAQITCENEDSVVCDISWQVTIKNGGTPFAPEEILAIIGSYPSSGAGSGVVTTNSYYTVDRFGKDTKVDGISGSFVAITGGYQNPSAGAGVATTDGYFIVDGNRDVIKASGISGDIISVTGESPASASSGVATTEGYFIVGSDGSSIKASGITGDIIAIAGVTPNQYGSGVATTEGYFIVDTNGNSVKASSVTGNIIAVIGSTPYDYGSINSGIATTDGYFISDRYGNADKVSGISGDIIAIVGDNLMSGSGVATTDGYFVVDRNGNSTKVNDVSGKIIAVNGGSEMDWNTYQYVFSSGVATTDGYFIVDDAGHSIQATGISGKITAIAGKSPAVNDNGAGVVTTDGYFVVDSQGESIKITEISGNILSITGDNPMGGSGVATTDGYYLVDKDVNNGDITATKTDLKLPKPPEFTGSPIELTGGILTDSTSQEVYDIQTVSKDRILGDVALANEEYLVWTDSEVFLEKEGNTDSIYSGITVKGAQKMNKNEAVFWTENTLYYLNISSSEATPIEAVTGSVISTGGDDTGNGIIVATSNGVWLIHSGGGKATAINGLAGTPLDVPIVGIFPIGGTGGYTIATTAGAFFITDKSTEEIDGISGQILSIGGGYQNVIATNSGIYLTSNGIMRKDLTSEKISGTVLHMTTGSSHNDGIGVATTDGYYLVDDTGVVIKATDISGNIIAVTGVDPTYEGSGVATTDGYYIVNENGEATKATGISGNIIAVTGGRPSNSFGVATTDGYYLVNGTPTATKISGISGSIVSIAGIDPGGYGSTVATTDGFYNVNESGVAKLVPEISLDQSEFYPISETPEVGPNSRNFVTRKYNVNTLAPGEEITYYISGKINKKAYNTAPVGEGVVVGNQAWVSFKETPRDKPPFLPKLPAYDSTNEFAFGQATLNNQSGEDTCTAVDGWQVPGDQCGQVYAQLPPTKQPLGSLGGLLWYDENRSGEFDNENVITLINQKVSLYQGENGSFTNKVGETFTNTQGSYMFNNLVPSTSTDCESDGNDCYYVVFEPSENPTRRDGSPLLESNDNDELTESWAWTIPWDKAPYYEANHSASFNGITKNIAVTSSVNENVNGGVITVNTAIAVIKGESKGLNSVNLPVNSETNISDPYDLNFSFTNTGNEALKDITFVDTTVSGPQISNVSCELNSSSVGSFTNSETIEGNFNDLELQPGETIDCTATLPSMNALSSVRQHEDNIVVNAVGVSSGHLVSDSDGWIAVIDGASSWSVNIVPSVNNGQIVKRGDEITYYITINNTGEMSLKDMVVTDDLSRLLNNVTIVSSEAELAAQGITINKENGKLVWTVDDYIVGGSNKTVSFTVKVNEDAVKGADLSSSIQGVLTNNNGSGTALPPVKCFEDTFDSTTYPCGTDHTLAVPPSVGLPLSGGKGALIFLIVSVLLGGGAVSYVVYRKKKNS